GRLRLVRGQRDLRSAARDLRGGGPRPRSLVGFRGHDSARAAPVRDPAGHGPLVVAARPRLGLGGAHRLRDGDRLVLLRARAAVPDASSRADAIQRLMRQGGGRGSVRSTGGGSRSGGARVVTSVTVSATIRITKSGVITATTTTERRLRTSSIE